MFKFLGGLLAIGGLVLSTSVTAQTLQANTAQLAFGNATEIAPVTQQLTLTNPLNYAIKVTAVKFFNIYGQPAFTVSPSVTFPFTVPAGGSQVVPVIFSPKHNIAHNTELVVETDSHGGNLAVDLLGQGKYSRTYYNNSENLSEEALKTALKSIVTANYNSLGYNNARDQIFMTIDNKKVNGQGASVNTLECVYTGRQVVGFTSRTDAQNTSDPNKNFNTEHTFPQGYFSDAEPMRSDMHHLFPTDGPANNSRGNQPFGIATTPYRADNINAPSHLGWNMVYEPRDAQKGRAARAMLYFVIRYQDYQNFFRSQAFFTAPVNQETILKDWNRTFAPTAVDVKRNDDIAASTRQRNRNPFVDYPQLADRITSFVTNSTAPATFELYNSPVMNYGMLQPNNTYTFNYVLVNNGNQTLNFTNPALSNTALLSFATGSGNNFTIAPGEAYTLKVNANLPTTDSIAESLTLTSNIPGQASLSIPVYANKFKVLSAGKNLEKRTFELYPNPVTEAFVVERPENFGKGAFEITITDALGKTVKQIRTNSDKTTLFIPELKRGMYVVKIASGSEFMTKKIVKL